MAEPKLEIEKRVERVELAIAMMAQWLVQAPSGFTAQDAEGIERILRGEDWGEKLKKPEEEGT